MLAKLIVRCKFPSKYKPSQFWNTNFPPHINPSKRAFEKYKSRGLFSEFYSMVKKEKKKQNKQRKQKQNDQKNKQKNISSGGSWNLDH